MTKFNCYALVLHHQAENQVDFGDSWIANEEECKGTPEDPHPCVGLGEDILKFINESCAILLEATGKPRI